VHIGHSSAPNGYFACDVACRIRSLHSFTPLKVVTTKCQVSGAFDSRSEARAKAIERRLQTLDTYWGPLPSRPLGSAERWENTGY